MLNGGEEDNNSFLFKQGYEETVSERVDAGDWELVADQFVPGWDNAEAQTLMEQILVDANNDVEAGFAAAIALALRAGEDIQEAAESYESELPSGGSSVELTGIEAESGEPTDETEGEGIVPYVALVPIGVTVDNVADSVIADGFRTVEELCTGDVASTEFCQQNS